jgi:hypothetical protein
MGFALAFAVITIIFHNEKEVNEGIGFPRFATYLTDYTHKI